MARKTSRKSGDSRPGRYYTLKRYMCGIKVACMMVVIAVSFSIGEAPMWVIVKAAMVYCGLAFAQWTIIKIWAACEELQAGTSIQQVGKE